MSIIASNPMILPGVGGNQNTSIAVEFQNGDKLVSLALNNSGGRMKKLGRADLRLFIRSDDVTETVFTSESERHIVHASLENFEKAMHWLNRARWDLTHA
jgi:hypothetical protein